MACTCSETDELLRNIIAFTSNAPKGKVCGLAVTAKWNACGKVLPAFPTKEVNLGQDKPYTNTYA